MLVLLLILLLILIVRKDRIRKIKLFYKKYKLLIISEVLLIAMLVVFGSFNQSVIIKEKDPHSNKILKYEVLKKGEIYTFYTTYSEKIEEGNSSNEEAISKILEKGKNFLNIKEKENSIKIKDINLTKVTVLVNDIQKDYKYGEGFSYYGATSCKCGTPIVFENSLNTITIILFLGIISIDLLLMIFIKDKSQQQDDDSNNN